MAQRYTITSYTVKVSTDETTIALDSTETPNHMGGTRVAVAHFGSGTEARQFVTRGGSLAIYRPAEQLMPILLMLIHESPVFVDEEGTFSTGPEPIGELEDEPA